MEFLWLAPAWFWALVLVPLALVAPRIGRAREAREALDPVHWLLRALAFVAVVLALAEPAWLDDDEPVRRVHVVDASASVARADVAAARADAAREESATTIEFGEPVDLAEGLLGALAAIPAGAPARVVAWTDGALRAADVAPVVTGFQARGIALDVVPLARRDDDLALVDLWAPEPLRVGHTGRVTARVVGHGRATLTLATKDAVWARLDDVPVDGVSDVEFVVEPAEAGFPELRLTLDALEGANALAETDALVRTLPVQDPLVALVLTERLSGSMEQLQTLVGPGLRLIGGDPESLDFDQPDLVVLDDMRAERLGVELQRRLTEAVIERGLGLAVSGGEAAFGPGGYHDTELDAVLPVESVQKEEKRDPSTTLVVIIDTSGSMGGNRVQLAKEVARLAIRRLLPHDKVGIVEFYGAKRWAAPIQPASNSIEIQRALNRLDAGGGTVILPAIEEAFYGLQNVDTRYKHVLILTDGGVESGAFEPIIRSMAEKGINVSTVLVGPEAHSEFLVNISNWGKGRFYSVANRFSLPEILLKQPTSARIPAWRPGSHAVRARGGAGWWGRVDPDELPALAGYTETKARPGAEVLIETERGAHPVVATWQVGLGRVLAVPTELTGPATEDWNQWDGYGAFLARMLARTAPRDGGPFAFELLRRGHEAVLRATRVVRGAEQPIAEWLGGEPIQFEQRAPGHFEARFVVAPEATVLVEAGSTGGLRAGRGVRLAARPERLREAATDPAAALDLERLAWSTGGELLTLGSTLPLAGTGGTHPRSLLDLRPWFLALALLAYLLDVAWRRRSSHFLR